MEAKENRSFLSGIPGWALSLLAAAVSFILLFFFADLFDEEIGYISYASIVVIACFFICMKHPKSYWYVPIICNIPGILAAFGEEHFYWASTLAIIICGGWILSLAGAIIGSIIGRRQEKGLRI